MSHNALDTALVKLAASSTALEYTSRPNLKDVKKARDEAKSAFKILDAAVALLEEGVYTVAEEPPKDEPLFNTAGQPAAGVHIAEPEETPVGEPETPTAPRGTLGMTPPHALDGLSENDALVAFEKRLEDAEQVWREGGKSMKAFKAVRKGWMQLWAYDTRTAFDALTAALDLPESDLLPPQKSEPAALVTAPTTEDRLEGEPDWENTAMVYLEEMADGLLTELVMLEDVVPDQVGLRERWASAFKVNPKGTWRAAKAIIADENASLEVPEELMPAEGGAA
jgi:hypothetical protein